MGKRGSLCQRLANGPDRPYQPQSRREVTSWINLVGLLARVGRYGEDALRYRQEMAHIGLAPRTRPTAARHLPQQQAVIGRLRRQFFGWRSSGRLMEGGGQARADFERRLVGLHRGFRKAFRAVFPRFGGSRSGETLNRLRPNSGERVCASPINPGAPRSRCGSRGREGAGTGLRTR